MKLQICKSCEYYEDDENMVPCVWCYDFKWFYCAGGSKPVEDYGYEITHWMPLPAAASGSERGE